MFPCSVFPPVALLHHLIYNTDSEPLACPRNVSFSYLYGWSNFWFRTFEDLPVLSFASRKISWKHENVLWLQKWTRRRFGRVSRTLDFSKLKYHLKSWTSPKPFPSCQKPLFQSESKWEAVDKKIVFFYSHSNKMVVFMSSFKHVAQTHLTEDFNV